MCDNKTVSQLWIKNYLWVIGLFNISRIWSWSLIKSIPGPNYIICKSVMFFSFHTYYTKLCYSKQLSSNSNTRPHKQQRWPMKSLIPFPITEPVFVCVWWIEFKQIYVSQFCYTKCGTKDVWWVGCWSSSQDFTSQTDTEWQKFRK